MPRSTRSSRRASPSTTCPELTRVPLDDRRTWGSESSLEAALEAGFDPARDPVPDRFLEFTLEMGTTNALRLLLEHGLDPNHALAGVTPLLVACAQFDSLPLRLFDDLLDRGADPNIPDSDGRKAVHIAAHLGRRKLVERLAPLTTNADGYAGADATPLLDAAEADHVLVLQRETSTRSEPTGYWLLRHRCPEAGVATWLARFGGRATVGPFLVVALTELLKTLPNDALEVPPSRIRTLRTGRHVALALAFSELPSPPAPATQRISLLAQSPRLAALPRPEIGLAIARLQAIYYVAESNPWIAEKVP